MKLGQATSLVEHPGHSNQKVHGRRGGAGKSVITKVAISRYGGKLGDYARFDRTYSSGKKTQRGYKLTPSSMKRLGKARLKQVNIPGMGGDYYYTPG